MTTEIEVVAIGARGATGATGPTGSGDGATGATGVGLPSGGATGDVPVKASDDDGDWVFGTVALLAVAGQDPAQEPIAPSLTADVGSLAVAARADHRHPLLLDPTGLADQEGTGASILFEYGAAITVGQAVYYTSAGKVEPADASTAATAPVIGIALEAGSSGVHPILVGTGIAVYRDDTNLTFSTVGGLVFLDTTAGELTQTAPVATDEVVQPVGIALGTHVLLYMMNPFYLTLV